MASVAELLQTAKRWHESGQLAQAEQLYRQILQANPQHAEALHLLGLIAYRAGRHDIAIEYINRSIRIDGRQPAVHNNLGEVYRASGQCEAARACYERALQLNPKFAAAHHNLGLLQQSLDQLPEAQASYEQAIRLQPNYAEAQLNLGNVFRAQSKLPEAVEAYQQALRCRPNYAEAINNLAGVLVDQKLFPDAIELLRQSLALQPASPDVYYNLGNAYKGAKQFAESVACYHEALRTRPDFFEARSNLGAVLQEQGQLDEAEGCFRQALALKPDLVESHNNLGMLYQEKGLLDEASACFEEVLRRDPNFGMAHYNLGMVCLTQGKFLEGWNECEWRWRTKVMPRLFPQPAWEGSSLDGLTILVHPEQGLGDTMQFVRYVSRLEKMAARVIVELQPPLVPLMQASGMRDVIAFGSPLPDFDVHVLLMSLPRIFQTRADNVPAEIPYLSADPDLIAMWRQRLASFEGFKIGINWQGNRDYAFDKLRSIPLIEFAPLAQVPDVSLISLQRKEGLDQLPEALKHFTIHTLGEDVDQERGAFMDTAAIMKNLDLVITSDTATAHLAGALGVPVWVALSHAPEWRWMLERGDSPWYPTMRLFRQLEWKEWSGVFARMAERLPREIGRSSKMAVAGG